MSEARAVVQNQYDTKQQLHFHALDWPRKAPYALVSHAAYSEQSIHMHGINNCMNEGHSTPSQP